VAGSETLLDIGLLAEGEVASGGDDAPALDNHRPIVQRGIMVEHRKDQAGGKVGVEPGPTIDDVLDPKAAGEYDQGAPALVHQHGAGVEDGVDLIRARSLRPDPEEPGTAAPKLGERPPQFRLIDDADENGCGNRDIAEEPEQYIQFKDVADGEGGEQDNHHLDQLLCLGLGYGLIEPIEQPCKNPHL